MINHTISESALPGIPAAKPNLAALAGAYVVTMRPYLMFLSGITAIAGMSFAPPSDIIRYGGIALAGFLSYGFGQALTDCFQTDTDSISSPYRPLTQGILSRRLTALTSLAGLALCMFLLSVAQPSNMLLGLLAAAGLALYTPFKRRWWGGPAYNSWIVALLFCMALFATGSAYPSAHPWAFGWTLGVVFFAYANFVLTGYLKDISADRATGYITMPVKFGMKPTRYASNGIAVVVCTMAIAAVTCSGMTFPGSIAGLLMITAGIIVCMIAQVALRNVQDERDSHRAIVPVVHAYLLIVGGIAALQQPGWSSGIVFFYVAFIFVLNLRPRQQQI